MERVKVSEMAVPKENKFGKKTCFNNQDMVVFTLAFNPGQTLPAHKHPGSSLLISVFTGSGVVIVDGQESQVAAGDALLLTGDEELAMRNDGSELLTMLVCIAPNPVVPT